MNDSLLNLATGIAVTSGLVLLAAYLAAGVAAPFLPDTTRKAPRCDRPC